MPYVTKTLTNKQKELNLCKILSSEYIYFEKLEGKVKPFLILIFIMVKKIIFNCYKTTLTPQFILT